MFTSYMIILFGNQTTKTMNKAEEYFKKNVIWNGTIVMNIVQLMESYHQSRVKDISDDLELRKSCMDIDTYQSYKRRDSFHKGWTALKNKLLKQ